MRKDKITPITLEEPLELSNKLYYKIHIAKDGKSELFYDKNNSDVNYYSLNVVLQMLRDTIEKDNAAVKLNNMKVGVKRKLLSKAAKTEANAAIRLIERTLAVANETLKKEAIEAYNREKGIKAIQGDAQRNEVNKLLKKV